MTTLVDRVADSRTQQLKGFVDILVEVVRSNGGEVSQKIAMREAAEKAELSVSEMPYVVNSAVADHRINADLRSGKLTLVV